METESWSNTGWFQTQHLPHSWILEGEGSSVKDISFGSEVYEKSIKFLGRWTRVDAIDTETTELRAGKERPLSVPEDIRWKQPDWLADVLGITSTSDNDEIVVWGNLFIYDNPASTVSRWSLKVNRFLRSLIWVPGIVIWVGSVCLAEINQSPCLLILISSTIHGTWASFGCNRVTSTPLMSLFNIRCVVLLLQRRGRLYCSMRRKTYRKRRGTHFVYYW